MPALTRLLTFPRPFTFTFTFIFTFKMFEFELIIDWLGFMAYRIYVEKRPGFDVVAEHLLLELKGAFGGCGLSGVRVLNRYDVDVDDFELFNDAVKYVLAEPQVDEIYFSLKEALDGAKLNNKVFAVEALPGQFDARANSAAECIQLISQGERPKVRCARVYILKGNVSKKFVDAIKEYLVNPVESRLASLDEADSIETAFAKPDDVEILEGFREFGKRRLAEFIGERGLAMDLADIMMLQDYFKSIGRDPSITEVKVVDTYWSDHCRHTTFGTVLSDVEIDDGRARATYDMYLDMRRELGREERPLSLMDMGTIGAKWLAARGVLRDLDESDEINACTVKVGVDVDGQMQDWLYLFKNETHNHPTEIEPFGGAATCLGGAIRDPLSGRSYVYQAMRLTGAARPDLPLADTLPGKLPQRKIVTEAAAGYSSYGNQIGLATGAVNEIYHPGYMAKRMEIGAVCGAAPAKNVRRECPAAGDVIILVGGRTGRDGIGGATGSSKAHSADSLDTCGAEVQKGNPPEERKIQRLFRNGEVTRLIKRCNDFGAGGVSVAIGELADGVEVDLDAVPLKYLGLDGTEIALSESQERMAVCVAACDADAFCSAAEAENLEATVVAHVTEAARVVMKWRGQTIVDISRDFLNTNGAPKFADAHINEFGAGTGVLDGVNVAWIGDPEIAHLLDAAGFEDFGDMMLPIVDSVTNWSTSFNKGLAERFDSTIGAGTVLMPFGGYTQTTPPLAMVSKLPVFGGKTKTVSGMAWGFDPHVSESDCYLGAYSAVVQSVAKLVATGFRREKMWLSFQEYFEKLHEDADRWGKPVAAVLGALQAQVDLSVAAIGGKDSMSGSFDDLDVPPTLVSFATGITDIDRIISPEYKHAGNAIVMFKVDIARAEAIVDAMDFVEALVGEKLIVSATTPGMGGFSQALIQACAGNLFGIDFAQTFDYKLLCGYAYGSYAVELAPGVTFEDIVALACERGFAKEGAKSPADAGEFDGATFTIIEVGKVSKWAVWKQGSFRIGLEEIFAAWMSRQEDVFAHFGIEELEGVEHDIPIYAEGDLTSAQPEGRYSYGGPKIARPRVLVPVFPGTNCEFDTQAAFERAGADVDVFVFNNLSPAKIKESVAELAGRVRSSQIVMLPGGFSGGDEPDGSAKFITSVFRAPELTDAVRELLQKRDGLMLGICNGFQALVKLGLVPFGDIMELRENDPTLTFNTIGRHQSGIVSTRVTSNVSPWMANTRAGEVYEVAISHGEGRFVACASTLGAMFDNGQVATQYVRKNGVAGDGELDENPNGSMLAIEGITSPDGRVFGKMGHSERIGSGLYKNVPGNYDMRIFEAGVAYFK